MKRIFYNAGAAEGGAGGEDATTVILKAIDTKMAGAVTKDELTKAIEGAATKADLDAIAASQKVTQELAEKLNEKLGQINSGNQGKKPETLEESVIKAMIAQADDIKKIGKKESLKLDVKASVMDFSTVFPSADVSISDLRPGIVGLPNRKLHIRSLLPGGSTSTANYVYVAETGGTGAPDLWAGYQDVKPKVDRTFLEKVAPVRTIPAIIDIAKNMVDDFAGLQSFLSNRLTEMYLDKEDNVLLFGPNDTAPNLTGITVAATGSVSAAARTIDRIVLTAAAMKNNKHYANGVVVNPITFAEMLLNQATDKSYSYPVVFNALTNQMTLAGMPVFEHQEIPVGKFLIGDWVMGAQLITRQAPTIEISYENDDNFERNMLSIRVEGRIALPIYYADAFAYGDKGQFSGS